MPWTMQWIPSEPSEPLQELEGCPGPAWVAPDNASEMPTCGNHHHSPILRSCASQILMFAKAPPGESQTVLCTLLLRDPPPNTDALGNRRDRPSRPALYSRVPEEEDAEIMTVQ